MHVEKQLINLTSLILTLIWILLLQKHTKTKNWKLGYLHGKDMALFLKCHVLSSNIWVNSLQEKWWLEYFLFFSLLRWDFFPVLVLDVGLNYKF